jgi:phosphoglycerate dehydrogenase-like enzyme
MMNMEKVNVAVRLPVDADQKKMLEAAGGDRCNWFYIDRQLPAEEQMPLLRQAEVVIGEPGIRQIRQCPKLRWIQMSWAGTDIYTAREGFPEGVKLTNATGSFHVVISEFILAVLLEMCRNLKHYAAQQKDCVWKQIRSEQLLYGKRALILGAGDIGTETARKLKAFGVHVTGMRRSVRPYPDCFDGMITMAQLDETLPLADIVIGCLPGTFGTQGLLDERRLRLMKQDAYLVNIGRGTLIDTDALVRVLEEGHLAGVALDVVNPEPLPADHPLWKFDRVILTPHVAGQSFGFSKDTENRILQICCENLKRYLNGEELVNQISFSDGYAARKY